jgi:hypothetical protein
MATTPNPLEGVSKDVVKAAEATGKNIPAPESAHDKGEAVHDAAGKKIVVRGGGSDYSVARDARKD